MKTEPTSNTKTEDESSSINPKSSTLFFENCYDVTGDSDSWKETGKTVFMRWIMPQAVVDLEEEVTDGCKHYFVTVEFSSRHCDWNGQRLRFGSDKEEAIRETKKIVEKLEMWPLFGTKND